MQQLVFETTKAWVGAGGGGGGGGVLWESGLQGRLECFGCHISSCPSLQKCDVMLDGIVTVGSLSISSPFPCQFNSVHPVS